jgi:hypothetical protein
MNAATYRFFVLFLLAPLFSCAGTVAHPPLTVLMDFEAPHSETSLRSLRLSLSHLLAPSNFAVDVQLKSDLPDHPQFGELVVFKMKGSCNIESSRVGPMYDERGPLALAYTSDGQVLHFGEVECDRVRHSLQRILGRNASIKSQQAYGTALAIVVAHELYHMLGNARIHTHEGLTRPELSAADLTNSGLAMSPIALETINKPLHSELPDH